ncbi:Methanogenesis regulatory protein FilR1 [uncultured archaeon]|nr:Methanogenesis regulatory protein FilR1 [uncultured archaeon]
MQDFLNIISSSDKRKKILLSLQDDPKTLGDFRRTLGFTSTGMLPQIRILKERNLVKQDDGQYTLTEIGQVVAGHLQLLVETLEVVEKHEEFWREHDVGAIPFPLLMRISELDDTRIIDNGIEELFEPHKEFIENILNSKKVMGISPIVHPNYPEFFLQLAERGTEVSLILTRKAFNKIEKEYNDMLVRGLSFKNGSLYISDEDIKLSCAITDVFLSISLFFKNGVFDSSKDLVSFDKPALLWGEELFNYFKERSVKAESL